ncbi:MAG: hypothetical protein JWM55_523 [Acidimicrobiaceae bacterium]|nr:hypothetical protein [Acidimicrobiaceae bacterium]
MLNGLRRLPECRFHPPETDSVDRIFGGVFVSNQFTRSIGPLFELGIASKGRGVFLEPRCLTLVGIRLIWLASMTNDPNDSNHAR